MDNTRLALRAELVRTREQARSTWQRGVLLMALAPAMLAASLIALFTLGGIYGALAIIFAGLYTFVGGITGLALVAGGAVDHRRSAKQLRALDAAYQLPAARLVKG